MPLGQTDHTAFTGKHAYRWTIICSQRCYNAGTRSTTASVAVLGLLLLTGALPSKHETLTQCCFNVGPAFKQHWIIVGHMSYTVLAAWYCEAGQSTEGQSVLLRSRVTSPNGHG